MVVPVIKNPPANAKDARDMGLIPELGRSTWKIPWIEEPGGLQTIVLQRVRHD